MGVPFAREAMLTARTITARELFDKGVVARVASKSQPLTTLLDELFSQLRATSPDAARMCKDLVRGSQSVQVGEQDETIKMCFEEMMKPDAPSIFGVAEFRAGRKAKWDLYHVQTSDLKSKL